MTMESRPVASGEIIDKIDDIVNACPADQRLQLSELSNDDLLLALAALHLEIKEVVSLLKEKENNLALFREELMRRITDET